MVTWQELIQFGLFLVALISLVIQANEKRSNRHAQQAVGYFFL